VYARVVAPQTSIESFAVPNTGFVESLIKVGLVSRTHLGGGAVAIEGPLVWELLALLLCSPGPHWHPWQS
jgi:hypothetical protein